MKPNPMLLSCLVGLFAVTAHAEIYKRVDKDGHVTYSSEPLKGGHKLHLDPLPTLPPSRPSKQRTESPADFPRVDAATQRDRDDARRRILEDELASEEQALAEARRNLEEGQKNPEVYRTPDGKVRRNVAKYEEKVNALQEQVRLHEKNIEAIRSELANLR